MYAALRRYHANVSRPRFERDLAEKDLAFLLLEAASGEIRGFSTLMQIRTTVDGQPLVAFFSGDTLIDRAYWGETVIPRLWARQVFQLAEAIRDVPTYWYLISSGYKTYRFLPVFFREFYPTYQRPTPPPVKRLLDMLGEQKFGPQYDPRRGIIRFVDATPLRPGVADLTERRLRDPHVAFFVSANPGHVQGDELACLAELSRDNLTPAGRRMLGN